jgi:hypothetical protein
MLNGLPHGLDQLLSQGGADRFPDAAPPVTVAHARSVAAAAMAQS